MTESLNLPDHLREQILGHCVGALPDEGCGLYAISGDLITEVYPTDNADKSPTGYTIPHSEHFNALIRAESRGWRLGGSFHSHPGSEALPSERDLEGALDPEWVYLIVGFKGSPALRAWEIRDGAPAEVALVSGDGRLNLPGGTVV